MNRAELERNTAVSQVAVVGAGPAGLMAAEVAAAAGAAVTLFDGMPTPGRKFLLAGRGGLNLTHSEPFAAFAARYGAAEPSLTPHIAAFSPADLQAWCASLGQPTFVGSSGRVFPKTFKASPLLRAWLGRLSSLGVTFRPRHRWTGWTAEGALRFTTPEGPCTHPFAAAVLALGGASWPQLGSDGAWTDVFGDAGLATVPLKPSNCAFAVGWSAPFQGRFEGQPLKSVALSFGERTVRGDAVVTRAGLEGGAIYALSAPLRDAIARDGAATMQVALRPDLSVAVLTDRLAARPPKRSLSTHLGKALRLVPAAVALLREGEHQGLAPSPSRLDAAGLAALINAVPVRLCGTADLARAISSAGGVPFDALDAGLMLLARPGTFLAGEMLDWEAPTGGYLLQAAFATGAAAGRGALAWATGRPPRRHPVASSTAEK